jgi:hypothetical protein
LSAAGGSRDVGPLDGNSRLTQLKKTGTPLKWGKYLSGANYFGSHICGMAKSIFDTCHIFICGEHKKLSFEHVPPQAAFNDQRILHSAFEKVLASENLDELRGKYQQKGAGAHTLCEKCNSDTGRWYGAAYAAWAHQAMRFVIGTRGRPSLIYPFNLYPLRVLKQVVCMFFSVNDPQFQTHQPDLVRFVRIPTKPAMHSNLKPATCSDPKPAGVPI